MNLAVPAIVCGVALGVVYTFSPLTVVALTAIVLGCQWAIRGTTDAERRWLLATLLVAIGLRLAAITGLFLTADPNIPYANFFGDEEFFKRKTTWVRNVAMGIPISTADFIYAFDKTGDNGYVSLLTYLQAIFGLSPYGIHVFNAACYILASLILYVPARQAFGGVAALAGLVILLFLPSLFFWSISALKEPVYFLVAALNLIAALALARGRVWWRQVLGIAVIALCALSLQSLREGGLALAAGGVLGGVTLSFLFKHRRLLALTLAVAPIVAALALRRVAVQDRVWALIHEAAMKHWGHINTAGQTYHLMDRAFYVDRAAVAAMTAADAVRYVVMAVWSYVMVPLPWQIESRSALAFVPEQMAWLLLLVMAVSGLGVALRRDRLFTSLLVAHALVAALLVAVSGGNIGTLVRHRGLAMPYLAWLAGVGVVMAGQRLLWGARAWRPDSPLPDPKAALQWH